ncbi:YcaO-like family protein [Fidelibacter multiformis]|uniref:YcaO-like family protein n=1 Tax=Fidelibacter multiformis TaxID=3377529 RepID=UPI0037DC1190
MKNHLVAGKDLNPEETIRRIQQTLILEDFSPEIVSENNIGGLFSVLIADKHSERFMANGKGISRELALASAYGEFMERFMTRFFFYDLWLTKDGPVPWVYDKNEIWTSKPESLLKNLKKFYPMSILQSKSCYDINQSPSEEPFCFLPFHTRHGEQLFLPVSYWRELYTSNGLAYGNNIYEARVQALCEIIERHVKYRVIRKGLSLPSVSPEKLKNPEIFYRAQSLLSDVGLQCKLLDASLGMNYPVMAFLIYTPDQQEAFLSFGAHPDQEIAIERTIAEAFQGRNPREDTQDFLNIVSDDTKLTGLPENLESHFINSTGILHTNIFKPPSSLSSTFCSFHGTSEKEWDHLCDIVEKTGFTILTRDIFWNGHSACQIIIPGFSEVYPYQDLIEKDFQGYCVTRNEVISLLERYPRDAERLVELLDSEYFRPDQDLGEALGVLFSPDALWFNHTVEEVIESH